MARFSSLLLAVDASPYAEAVVRYAGLLSQRLELPLKAVHVLDSRAVVPPSAFDVGMGDPALLAPSFDPAVEAVLRDRAEEVRAATDAQLARLGLTGNLELLTGVPEAELTRRADADTLLVIGKAGEGAVPGDSARFGSVAEHAVRRAEGAVLLVPGHFTEPERLLLGYDGSSGAEAALADLLGLARALRLPASAVGVQHDEAAAQRVLEPLRARAERVALEAEADRGEPGVAIAAAARAGDLVVIGAFGRGRVAEWFGGSTTSEVVRRADVPVLLYGPNARRAANGNAD